MIHIILQHIAWYLFRALMMTWKWEKIGEENLEKARKAHPNGAFLQAFWHEHILAYTSAHAWTIPFTGMVSRSKDGDYAAFLMKKMGFLPVRGSSRKKGKDKGGQAAMEILITEIRKGYAGGLTVDGPKGPRHICKPGIVFIAEETGALVVPGAAAAKSYWEFNSWDRFKIPKPFTTIKVIYGRPIHIPPAHSHTEIHEYCKHIEEEIMNLERSIQWSLP